MPSLAHLTGRIVTIGALTGLSALHAAPAVDGRDIALNGNKAGAHACASCHGEAGEGIPADGYPRLSKMSVGYLVHQLDSFAEGRRGTVVMSSIAAALSPEDRQAVATYYSSRVCSQSSRPATGGRKADRQREANCLARRLAERSSRLQSMPWASGPRSRCKLSHSGWSGFSLPFEPTSSLEKR